MAALELHQGSEIDSEAAMQEACQAVIDGLDTALEVPGLSPDDRGLLVRVRSKFHEIGGSDPLCGLTIGGVS